MKINKITFFTLINLCLILGSYAQTFPITEKVVGKNLITNKDIIAKEYTFSKLVYKYYIDISTKSIVIQTRNYDDYLEKYKKKGDLFYFSLDNMNTKWSKKIDYSKYTIFTSDNVILLNNIDKTILLNLENGKEQWITNNNMVFNNTELGFGYKTSSYYIDDNALTGINLKTGKNIWNREFYTKEGIDNIVQITDSIVIILAEGIHYLNINNGKGWNIPATITAKDHERIARRVIAIAAGTVVAPALFGVLTNIYCYPTKRDYLITNINSNVLNDEKSNIYFASKKEIVKVKDNGKVIWRTDLPEEFTSTSEIIKKDSLIILINYGLAKLNYNIKFGKPFIAALNAENGQIYFLKTIEDIDYITMSQIKNDLLIVASDKCILKYSTTNGDFSKKHTFNKEQIGLLNKFISDEIFIKADSNTFKQLNKLDTSKLYISSNTGNIIELDNNLDITNYFNSNQYFICKNNKANLKLLFNENKSYVIDYYNNKVCELNNITEDAIIVNNKIYDFIDNKFIVIELY